MSPTRAGEKGGALSGAVDPGPDRVTVSWPDGRRRSFSYLWLRDNCGCPECRDPTAGERLFDTVGLPPDLRAERVVLDGGLHLTWPDGHRTSFSESWLLEHARGDGGEPAASGEVSWDASIAAAPPEIACAEVCSGPSGLRRCLELVRSYGFCIVRGVPTEVDAVASLAERIGPLQPSNFGRTFHVVSKAVPENLAYTAHRLHPHTDIPNRYAAAQLQLLHCLELDSEGGESIVVDGHAAARRLAAIDPDAHRLLSEVWVPWRYQDDQVDITNRFPVIRTAPDGHYVEIRFHTALMDTLQLDLEVTGAFYRALVAFGRLLRDPAAQYAFRMQAGDCQIFDNQRVLHGRAAFDPSSGARHLQGCYVDKDDFLGRLRVLEREAAGAPGA